MCLCRCKPSSQNSRQPALTGKEQLYIPCIRSRSLGCSSPPGTSTSTESIAFMCVSHLVTDFSKLIKSIDGQKPIHMHENYIFKTYLSSNHKKIEKRNSSRLSSSLPRDETFFLFLKLMIRIHLDYYSAISMHPHTFHEFHSLLPNRAHFEPL